MNTNNSKDNKKVGAGVATENYEENDMSFLSDSGSDSEYELSDTEPNKEDYDKNSSSFEFSDTDGEDMDENPLLSDSSSGNEGDDKMSHICVICDFPFNSDKPYFGENPKCDNCMSFIEHRGYCKFHIDGLCKYGKKCTKVHISRVDLQRRVKCDGAIGEKSLIKLAQKTRNDLGLDLTVTSNNFPDYLEKLKNLNDKHGYACVLLNSLYNYCKKTNQNFLTFLIEQSKESVENYDDILVDVGNAIEYFINENLLEFQMATYKWGCILTEIEGKLKDSALQIDITKLISSAEQKVTTSFEKDSELIFGWDKPSVTKVRPDIIVDSTKIYPDNSRYKSYCVKDYWVRSFYDNKKKGYVWGIGSGHIELIPLIRNMTNYVEKSRNFSTIWWNLDINLGYWIPDWIKDFCYEVCLLTNTCYKQFRADCDKLLGNPTHNCNGNLNGCARGYCSGSKKDGIPENDGTIMFVHSKQQAKTISDEISENTKFWEDKLPEIEAYKTSRRHSENLPFLVSNYGDILSEMERDNRKTLGSLFAKLIKSEDGKLWLDSVLSDDEDLVYRSLNFRFICEDLKSRSEAFTEEEAKAIVTKCILNKSTNVAKSETNTFMDQEYYYSLAKELLRKRSPKYVVSVYFDFSKESMEPVDITDEKAFPRELELGEIGPITEWNCLDSYMNPSDIVSSLDNLSENHEFPIGKVSISYQISNRREKVFEIFKKWMEFKIPISILNEIQSIFSGVDSSSKLLNVKNLDTKNVPFEIYVDMYIQTLDKTKVFQRRYNRAVDELESKSFRGLGGITKLRYHGKKKVKEGCAGAKAAAAHYVDGLDELENNFKVARNALRKQKGYDLRQFKNLVSIVLKKFPVQWTEFLDHEKTLIDEQLKSLMKYLEQASFLRSKNLNDPLFKNLRREKKYEKMDRVSISKLLANRSFPFYVNWCKLLNHTNYSSEDEEMNEELIERINRSMNNASSIISRIKDIKSKYAFLKKQVMVRLNVEVRKNINTLYEQRLEEQRKSLELEAIARKRRRQNKEFVIHEGIDWLTYLTTNQQNVFHLERHLIGRNKNCIISHASFDALVKGNFRLLCNGKSPSKLSFVEDAMAKVLRHENVDDSIVKELYVLVIKHNEFTKNDVDEEGVIVHQNHVTWNSDKNLRRFFELFFNNSYLDALLIEIKTNFGSMENFFTMDCIDSCSDLVVKIKKKHRLKIANHLSKLIRSRNNCIDSFEHELKDGRFNAFNKLKMRHFKTKDSSQINGGIEELSKEVSFERKERKKERDAKKALKRQIDACTDELAELKKRIDKNTASKDKYKKRCKILNNTLKSEGKESVDYESNLALFEKAKLKYKTKSEAISEDKELIESKNEKLVELKSQYDTPVEKKVVRRQNRKEQRGRFWALAEEAEAEDEEMEENVVMSFGIGFEDLTNSSENLYFWKRSKTRIKDDDQEDAVIREIVLSGFKSRMSAKNFQSELPKNQFNGNVVNLFDECCLNYQKKLEDEGSYDSAKKFKELNSRLNAMKEKLEKDQTKSNLSAFKKLKNSLIDIVMNTSESKNFVKENPWAIVVPNRTTNQRKGREGLVKEIFANFLTVCNEFKDENYELMFIDEGCSLVNAVVAERSCYYVKKNEARYFVEKFDKEKSAKKEARLNELKENLMLDVNTNEHSVRIGKLKIDTKKEFSFTISGFTEFYDATIVKGIFKKLDLEIVMKNNKPVINSKSAHKDVHSKRLILLSKYIEEEFQCVKYCKKSLVILEEHGDEDEEMVENDTTEKERIQNEIEKEKIKDVQEMFM